MTPDALAPCVTRSSAAMVLTIWDDQVIDFREKDLKYLHNLRADQ